MSAARALISGRVQRVGYREWTLRTALALGLDGWVRNLPDGRVEALFSGPEERVSAMLERCRSGPALAQVENVESSAAEGAAEQGFFIQDARE